MPICRELNRCAALRSAERTPIDARALLGLLSSLLFAAAGPALGQITNNSDTDPPTSGSLRAEVNRSMPGERIAGRIDAGDAISLIDLRTAITFDNDVEIDNSNPLFSRINVDAPAEGSLFEIEDGVDVILRDLGIVNNGDNRDDDIVLQGATSSLTFDVERANQRVLVDIVGNGSVVKQGSARLELFGINAFLGGLTILEGDVVGDELSFNTPTILLAPDAATETVRLIYQHSGFQSIGALGPRIMDASTNGGSVQLVKQGSGTLDISQAMIDPTVGIRVQQGTIFAGPSNFANDHAFTIDSLASLNLQGAMFTMSSASSLAGAGTFTTDAGNLTMTGDLSGFTGVFDVRAPLLALTSGALVSIDPDVPPSALDFDLVIDDPNAFVLTPGLVSTVILVDDAGLVFGGDISGNGRFVKAGTGTTRLSGLATHTGGTQVAGGTLRGNLGNLRGDIALSAGTSLEIDQASNATFAGTIDSIGSIGSSSVRLLGAGIVTLQNTQPFRGTLDVAAGGLVFSAGTNLPNAGLTIGTGGSGSRVSLGANFSPLGGPNNTVTIGGPLTIGSDARVTIGIGGATDLNTRFAATGPVVIQPGAQLVVQTSVGVYTPGLTYDVVTGSSVTGDFAIEQSLYFFDISGMSVGNAYRLTLASNGNMLVTAASTPNQLVTASELDLFRVAPTGGDPRIIAYQASIASASVSDIDPILDSVSPDDLASATQIQLANASRTWRGISNRLALHRIQGIGHHDARETRRQQVRRNAAERARQRRGSKQIQPDAADRPRERTGESLGERRKGPWVAWIQGSGLLGELDSSDAKGFDYISAGPTLGADRALTEDVRLGFALAGNYNRYDTKDGDNEGTGGAVEGAVYGAWVGDPVEVLLGARYAHAWVESERVIQVGFESDRTNGEFEGDIFGTYAELTRGFDLPLSAEIAPMASVAYTRLMWGDFDEDGLSPLRMQVDEQEVDSVVTSLGFRVSAEREMDDGILFRPRFKALWNHEWADVEREVAGSFASNPTTGLGSFTVEAAEVPRDFAELSAGWEVGYVARANLFLEWEGRFGDELIENSISLGARVTW